MFKFMNTLFLRKFWLSVLLRTNSGAGLGICCKSWMGEGWERRKGRTCFPCSEFKICLNAQFSVDYFVVSTSGADKISIFFLY